MSHLEDLRAQARSLPASPGVYFWKDGSQHVLYIGKAVNLRSRVTSYFSTARHDRRVRELLGRARSLEHEVVATELEALLRESALIKREQPPFNRMLRSSRLLPYLKLDAAHPDPYLEVTREVVEDGSLYFGPFRSATVLRETLRYVHDVLPLRKCTAANPRCAPCLYYQMHKCAAPLLDDEHRRRHQDAILQLRELLDGRTDRVIGWLEKKRDRLSESLLFEQAAEVQGRLEALQELVRRHALLEAALHSRCVLVRCQPEIGGGERLLIIAHAAVISMRSLEGVGFDQILGWVKAHQALLRTSAAQETELDAASILERWLNVNRDRVRWVTVPPESGDDDLRDRVRYVFGDVA